MNTALLLSGLSVGLVVTILTSVFKTINFSARQRHSIAVVLSAIGGALLSWVNFNGDYSVPHLLETFSAVYASSQLIYGYVLNGSNLDQVLTAFSVFGKKSDAATTVVEAANQVLADPQTDTTPGA